MTTILIDFDINFDFIYKNFPLLVNITILAQNVDFEQISILAKILIFDHITIFGDQSLDPKVTKSGKNDKDIFDIGQSGQRTMWLTITCQDT